MISVSSICQCFVGWSISHFKIAINSPNENIDVDDDGRVTEAEKEKVAELRSEDDDEASKVASSSALFPVDIERLRSRVFNFYPRNGKPFKSVLPDVRYSEVAGRRR